jgi:hypothetical protein
MAKIKKAQFGAPIRKGGYRGGCAATTSGADRAERREGRQAERDYKKAVRVAGREERKAERAEKKVPKAQAGLKASNKRVGPVDPNGAWTKVQEMNLPPRNIKTKASLTEDKQLGATKMAKEGKWIQKAIKKPGALRSSLGVKKGEKIPAGKLAAAAKKPGKMGQRARLAQTLKKMKK